MTQSFTIIKRKDRFDKDNINFNYLTHRNFDYPLIGFSDYKDSLIVGDIIGVVLKSEDTKEGEFTSIHCDIVKENMLEQLKEHYPKKFEYNEIEEHIFQITDIDEKNEFSITPIFIEGKIISKKLIVTETEFRLIPNQFIDKEKCFENFDFWKKFGYELFEINQSKKFLNKLEKYFKSEDDLKIQYKFFVNKNDYIKLPNLERNKAICLPYEDYSNLIFDQKDKEVQVYFDFLNVNKELLINLFGKEVFTKLGTPNILIENSEKIIDSVFDLQIENKISYDFYKPDELVLPKIDHQMKKINFSNIFRVYKTDYRFIAKRPNSNYLRDWSGRPISKNVLKFLQEKNYIRIIISEKESKCWFNTYFQILKKINENSYFVCSDDPYINELEDSLFIVNPEMINELPLEWEGNENLKENAEFISVDGNETNKEFDLFCELKCDGLFDKL